MFKIILEVRTSNCAAIGLYEKLGYQTIGIRKDYYPYQLTTRDSTNAVLQKSSTREDAVVMEKILVR
jgi:ribosomal protein S18 acetylase RimI-like enzyme